MSSPLDIARKILLTKGKTPRVFPKSINESPTIRIIGPRSSGKTVYIAALSRWPNADPNTSQIQSVIPVNKNGERLIERAKNLLEQGDQLQATGKLGIEVENALDYSIQITLKNEFHWLNFHNREEDKYTKLSINCKDYPGEFFQDIIFQSNSELLQNYIQDCQQAKGILFLVDGMSYRQDITFANGLQRFLVELDRKGKESLRRRIALVITKCEQPELWVNRYDPEKIIRARFRKIFQSLQDWENNTSGSVEFFTASAFGMVGKDYPEPNMQCLERKREGITSSILKYPTLWKPFGLVAPIYWLCTGKHHELLEQEE